MGGLGLATQTASTSYLSQASCVIVSGFTAAPDLDTYPLRNLIRPWCAERAKPGRGKPVLIMHIGLFSLFSRHISRMQSFQQNRHISFLALVALKLLVSLISRLVACSPRIVVDTHTHTHTHTQNDYCNPRCACAPRVNYTRQIPASAEQAHPCHSERRAQVSLGSQSSGEEPEISSARVVHTSYTGPRRTHTLQCGPEMF